MFKSLGYLFLVLFPLITQAQSASLDDFYSKTGLQHNSLQVAGNTIDYLVSDEKASQKGIIFYAQGSLPSPLFLFLEDNFYFTSPIRYDQFENDFRFVVISKPGIPIVADSTNLTEQNTYINDHGEIPKSYTDRHYLNYYVNTLDTVINHLLSNSVIDYDKVVVMGHSEGARIVVKTATMNENITHVVYLSGNPLGRIDESVRRERESVLIGAKSEEEANEEIQKIYKRWAEINMDKNSLFSNGGDSNYTWTSFSENTVDDLLKIEVPLFVGYGTRDLTSRYCDLLPLDFTTKGKDNLYHKPYLGYDHSFFKIGLDGRVDYDSGIFDKVIDDALSWVIDN